MAKKPPASPDDIMSPAEMKPILAIAKRGDPVSAVIGLTKDKDGVILLDKKVKPKALLAMLRKQAEQAGLEVDRTSLRFGTAAIDDDGKLVTFTLNKEAPGAYEMKMVVPLRKAGYSKVAFTVDGNLENEGEPAPSQSDDTPSAPQPPQPTSEEPQPETAPSAPAAPVPPGFDHGPLGAALAELVRQIPQAAERTPELSDSLQLLAEQAQAALRSNDIQSATGLVKSLGEAVQDAMTRTQEAPATQGASAQAAEPQTPEAGPGETQAGATPNVMDVKSLSQRAQRLGAMVPGAIQKAPSLRENLVKLTTEAIGMIKSGDAMSAALTLDVLEDELQRANDMAQTGEGPSTSSATPNAPAGLAKPSLDKLNKSKLAWKATRQAVETQLDQLHKKMAEAYDGHGFAADLEKVFKSKVEPMMDTLDHSLADVLEEVANAANPGEQAKLVADAVKAIERYESYLSSEPLIRQLDQNPFVPLRMEEMMTKTLEVLSKSVRDVAREAETLVRA